MGINYFQRNDRDARFVLFEYLDMERLLAYEAFKDFEADDFRMILDESLKVCRDVLGPTLKDGDEEGLVWDNGEVITPESFKECWKVLSENGWMGMPVGPEYGGQGLPQVISGQVHEFLNGANMCMQIYTGLAAGAGHLIETYGRPEDKALFCEKMYTGTWGGTMCLTEPDAGSDVGWLRTKAVPDPDSSDPIVYKIEGTKRFISGGNHDLTENIIHLLLARIEGAPAGTKGVSLFIVPKYWVNSDGSMGEPNDIFCNGFEHKMGLHGSATCTMNFGESGKCRGILLGEPHSGMAKMFQLMNEARLGTGSLALGAAASAYDAAADYARERLQGPPFTDRKADRVPIIKHEDVRRMLMNLKSGTEAMRAMLGKLFYLSDVAMHEPDEALKTAAQNRLDLFTPLAKAYCSDYCYELTREAIQVMGGSGYCREYPCEQYARDVKSASIYEGTTYIQSLDLVGRKMMMEGGKVFGDWLNELKNFAADNAGDSDFSADMELLGQASDIVGDFAAHYMKYFQENRLQMIPLTSTRFQECMSEALLAQIMLEMGIKAREKLAGAAAGSADEAFYKGKIESAKYFCRNILVNIFARHKALTLEDTSALDIPEEAFRF